MYDREDLSCYPDLSKHREFLASLFPTDEFLLLTPEKKKHAQRVLKNGNLKITIRHLCKVLNLSKRKQ